MQYRHTQLAGPRHILAACKGRSVFAHHLHACLRDFPQPPPGFHRCTNFCSSFACTCEVCAKLVHNIFPPGYHFWTADPFHAK
eukprot:1144648-Pelagomonas_calceolata.AAC.4